MLGALLHGAVETVRGALTLGTPVHGLITIVLGLLIMWAILQSVHIDKEK